MSQALYRKNRPRALNEVIGQEHITNTLARALKAGRVNHAYLFTGPRGVGKTSVARILAHEINKLPYQDVPHLDIIEIDAASNRRIDDIRDLRDKVHITPIKADYKIYIVDEVHMLTGESFNALLKTLEEPPSHVVFILATTESHKLPATIISRTQRFSFRPVSKTKVVDHLKQIAINESLKITDTALNLIAEYGEGSFRDSIGLLDQLAHVSEGEITEDSVVQTLGLAPQSALEKLVEAIADSDHKELAKNLGQLESSGTNISALVGQLCQALANKAAQNTSFYELIDKLLEVPRAYNPGLKLLTTLSIFVAKNQSTKSEPKTAALNVAVQPIVITKPALPKIKDQPKEVSKPDTNSEPTQPLNSLTDEDWQKVLQVTKQKHAALYSVLKQAQPELSNDELVLKFKFALHSKKLDDNKQKTQLVAIIRSTLGSAPAIKTAVDKLAVPGQVNGDPTAATVAEIMGGGEILNAEKL